MRSDLSPILTPSVGMLPLALVCSLRSQCFHKFLGFLLPAKPNPRRRSQARVNDDKCSLLLITYWNEQMAFPSSLSFAITITYSGHGIVFLSHSFDALASLDHWNIKTLCIGSVARACAANIETFFPLCRLFHLYQTIEGEKYLWHSHQHQSSKIATFQKYMAFVPSPL